ncbi:DNA-binding transcriptional LysR family regulator [Moryella indoligenes]|uniref:DNA-binding transcriptional LysR family regulator n=1 Tax=Moryella indoligenes TaxID=371674 RepID=A0AAE3VAP0_9FIRM|nr:LysR family transcriptional regulator [Moryella indoligenes]MDQ0152435.1 DNA-binding transcriptional LysR family regulator [Moryella indoligenes]
MDTKNLKYFVGVAQYGSINQAAKAMYISQPQLSHIIKSIEEEVGFDLFQRTNQGSRLTRNGESFLAHCKVILNEMESLDHFISQTHRQGSRLVVSMTRFSHTAVCFNEVCARHQDQENLFLRLHETSTSDVIDDVANGYSEIGVVHFSVHETDTIMRNFENKRLKFTSIAKFKPYVFLSAKHELLKAGPIDEMDINDLLSYGFVRYIGQYEDFFYHISTEQGIIDLNDSSKIIYVNDRMEQIRLLSATNFYTIGIAKFPYQGSLYDVVNIPLKNCSEHLRFGIITKEHKKATEIELEFMAEVRQRYRALSDEVKKL